ncbi:hypothetical protein OG204_21040 [Streptomyces sp. NBC_01387]|uniref:hypothetical protein n=1 Tax=unclassified Streptomyces TaxID=2593676 RepID=UPI0020252EC1|nr:MULTISPECIES: hypothetical protein [unclassified Streptomyces]WSC20763.1 hypothetical protein OIE60_14275 [Streptomyces sp. NBC_01766]
MKLRNAAAAGLAALALVLMLPGSALAATGEFHYKYVDDHGQEQFATVHDPQSGRCINLYGVDSDELPPGFGPHNQTDSWVTVYVGTDCQGPEWQLRPHGRPARDDLELRSVRFGLPE